jgi:hypothetical protein
MGTALSMCNVAHQPKGLIMSDSKIVSPATTLVISKVAKVATDKVTERVDISKLGFIEQVRLLKELNEAINAKRAEELKTIVNGFQMKVTASGFTIPEAIAELQTYMPIVAVAATPVKERAAKGTKLPHNYTDADSTGTRATPGVSYKHPTTGAVWTKAASGKGAPNKDFLALIQAGNTWAALQVPAAPAAA